MKPLLAQPVPHPRQLKDESGDGAFALDARGVGDAFHAAIRPVDLDGFGLGVQQPTQLRAICHVLLQLELKRLQPVGIGAKFDDKVRTEVHEAFAVLRFKAAGQQPTGIRSAPCTIGQDETSGGIEADSAIILVSPDAQSHGDTHILRSSERVDVSHNDNFALGSHFQREIGVIGKKRGEVVVRHGSSGIGRWKLAVLDQENGFRLSQRLPTKRKQYGGIVPTSESSDDFQFDIVRRIS